MRIRSTSQNRHVDFICLDRYLVSRPSVKGPPIIDLVFLAWHDHHGTVAVVRALAAHRTQWEFGETAMASRPDCEQAGASRLLAERFARISLQEVRNDFDSGPLTG